MRRPVFPAMALAFGALAAAAALPESALAQVAEQTPLEARGAQVVMLLNGEVQPEDVFTPRFRAAIADAQIKALSSSLTAQLGPALEVSLLAPSEGTRAALEIRFERGIAKGGITIDPAAENRVSELVFQQVEPLAPEGDTPERIAADVAALPGRVNAWFAPLDGGAPVLGIGAETPLALGSTVKLYVLAALAEDVKAGKRRWTDVVPLTAKSYPSGMLQSWPSRAPVTLHTLASLMIAISDNTATDQLIAVLGRERILKLMADSGHADPAANTPLLDTRELFVMKAGDEARIASYRAGDVAARTTLIADLRGEAPPLERINAAFAGGPKALDIEWFASPADLAKLFTHMRRTADPEAFTIMAISPSAPSEAVRANWDYIGYKGGSEPGVLNLTWLLRDRAGEWYVLTLGWNDPAAVLDEGKLDAIARRILLLPR